MPRTPPRQSRRRRRTKVGRRSRNRRQRRATVVRSPRYRGSPPSYPGVSPDYDYGGVRPYDASPEYSPESNRIGAKKKSNKKNSKVKRRKKTKKTKKTKKMRIRMRGGSWIEYPDPTSEYEDNLRKMNFSDLQNKAAEFLIMRPDLYETGVGPGSSHDRNLRPGVSHKEYLIQTIMKKLRLEKEHVATTTEQVAGGSAPGEVADTATTATTVVSTHTEPEPEPQLVKEEVVLFAEIPQNAVEKYIKHLSNSEISKDSIRGYYKGMVQTLEPVIHNLTGSAQGGQSVIRVQDLLFLDDTSVSRLLLIADYTGSKEVSALETFDTKVEKMVGHIESKDSAKIDEQLGVGSVVSPTPKMKKKEDEKVAQGLMVTEGRKQFLMGMMFGDLSPTESDANNRLPNGIMKLDPEAITEEEFAKFVSNNNNTTVARFLVACELKKEIETNVKPELKFRTLRDSSRAVSVWPHDQQKILLTGMIPGTNDICITLMLQERIDNLVLLIDLLNSWDLIGGFVALCTMFDYFSSKFIYEVIESLEAMGLPVREIETLTQKLTGREGRKETMVAILDILGILPQRDQHIFSGIRLYTKGKAMVIDKTTVESGRVIRVKSGRGKGPKVSGNKLTFTLVVEKREYKIVQNAKLMLGSKISAVPDELLRLINNRIEKTLSELS